MGVALAELCLLGKSTQHSQVGYIGHATGVPIYVDSKLKESFNYKYTISISPAKVREKPQVYVENREHGLWKEGRFSSLAENASISISRMTETSPTKYWV